MSEGSRSRVTITLGRSGQVIRMRESDVDTSYSDVRPVAGKKRSVRDRLGDYVDSSDQLNQKRLRGDSRSSYAVDEGVHLSKDDLRYKIMQKSRLKHHSQEHEVDLRNILSRPAQSSSNRMGTVDRMPEQNRSRMNNLDGRDDRERYTDIRDGRNLLPMSRYLRRDIPYSPVEHSRDPREHHRLETREGRHGFLEMKETRYRMPEPYAPSARSEVAGMRASSGIPRMEHRTNSNSPWNLDQIRKRSPDEYIAVSRASIGIPQLDSRTKNSYSPRLRRRSPDEPLATSGGVMAPKRDGIPQKRYPLSYAGTSTDRSKDAFEFARVNSASYSTKMASPHVQTMTAGTVVQSPPPVPPSGLIRQRNSHSEDEQDTVDNFMSSLGLERFAILFKVEEVDMYSLKRMSDHDLAALGIPMGPRKKIFSALLRQSSR